MPLPPQREIELPLLRLIESSGGKAKPQDLYDRLADAFNLSPEERSEPLESGPVRWWNSVQWARQRLVQAGQIDGSERGVWAITDAGRSRLGNATEVSGAAERLLPPQGIQLPSTSDERAPVDTIDTAIKQLRHALAAELLQTIAQRKPEFFERLVIDLLLKMGYGGTRSDTAKSLGRSGDEGVDGVISQDALGLDRVYIQAKRWDKDAAIGRPEIQRFAGALAGQRARKGVFITTAGFSREAREYMLKIDTQIVLIDGERLATLMMDLRWGVHGSVVRDQEY